MTNAIKSDIEIINDTMNGQLSDLKKKMLDELNKNIIFKIIFFKLNVK